LKLFLSAGLSVEFSLLFHLVPAARLRKLERVYVIGGGDLVYSDTAGG
jgi:hypothetical protein